MVKINHVDVCVGLAWGDEAKGKIVSYLSKTNDYNFVCRWNGGNNAGHTIYKNNNKYITHLIPSGIFYDITSIIGPDCVVNLENFFKEINYLKKNGFNTNLVKVSPKAHVITNKHIEDDIKKNSKLGTTAKGIGPCYRDKFERSGYRIMDIPNDNPYYNDIQKHIWDEKIYGNILCEGAQGVWLDINYGNYPYVTSSHTLPYSCCSLGFPPQKIRYIYGAAKIYDTRSGTDPDFPESLLDVPEFIQIGEMAEEYGCTTGRKRKINWLNVNKLINSINISGTTHIIVSKVDIFDKIQTYKYYYNNEIISFTNLLELESNLKTLLLNNCNLLKEVNYSNNPETIDKK